MGDMERPPKPFNINWLNIVFLTATPILALIGAIWHGLTWGIGWIEVGIFLFWYFACGLSITVGYHRLFSHRSHEAKAPLRLFYALFGAGAFENSILEWCSDHRIHHRLVDQEEDPYSAAKGFWWSHVGWIIFDDTSEPSDFSNVKDLNASRIVRFQHRFIFVLGFLVGWVAPGLLGYALGGVGAGIGGFVWGGLVRTVWVHHGTFLINSAAHIWGTQPYATSDSSRDNPFLAFFTFGEGYHNFHHTFQADYRNGHRWFHFDPSKWWIWSFSLVKLTSGLKRTPKWSIEVARMDTELAREVDAAVGVEPTLLEQMQQRAAECRESVRALQREIDAKRKELRATNQARAAELKAAIEQTKSDLALVRADFRRLIDEMSAANRAAVA